MPRVGNFKCGHKRTKANTIVNSNGSHSCRECKNDSSVRSATKQRAYYKERRINVNGRLVSIDIPHHLHGTATGYTYYSCRCDLCTRAGSDSRRVDAS